MEKDNLNENEINDEVEENEIKKISNTEEETDNNVNKEVESLITSDEESDKQSSSKFILANALDQLLMIAGSALLVLLCDIILKLCGYMFVRDNGSIILAGGIIYFIINCIYGPIMEKSKLENTFGKKILNMN
ncbi:MAG: RDD family protein [Clostridium beijerinckii]|uniref:RDD family protein n=1 Tax=Clostridium diolis TaxID=223919 RepID=UPI000B3FCDC9|nr:RDD family protein [Clostridium diolis]MCI1478699.1 RDD family protein [Clostridium beijerinckii]MCI1579888.1 RDD family protein [Clostridium beijerinckii]MCI1582197.1 RDD family protein [Clostridium beijerinckii]MCI1622714.1 RDD family protein [Clostridium beijerinckii]OVE70028.1 RDD family protein [Clostridium diolis]